MTMQSSHDRRLRIMLGAHCLWLAVVCLLGAWWGHLLLRQAEKIAKLEEQQGWARSLTETDWHRTQRMLFWESSTFFVLIFASTLFLFWFYWRDLKRSKGLQAFFASVTHELRTPLTSIRLQAESIADSLPDEGSQRELIQRLMEDSIRLESQVNRTLELARVEGGGPVYLQSLQIKPWLDRFLKSWGADYRGKIEFHSQVEDVLIEADPTALQVIFKNIFENSIRHSKQEKVLISIVSMLDQNGFSFLIRDNGLGYLGNKKTLGKIFQRGAASQGTGVGLYLVKVLMRRMGGWVGFSPHLAEPKGFEVVLWFREGKATHA